MAITMNQLKIGQTVFARECSVSKQYVQRGVVDWVHPENRFAVILLDGGYRECFFLSDLSINNVWFTQKGDPYKMPVLPLKERTL